MSASDPKRTFSETRKSAKCRHRTFGKHALLSERESNAAVRYGNFCGHRSNFRSAIVSGITLDI
jgi:hypothetical protein